MPGEIPLFIEGTVVVIAGNMALIKVPNGNIYEIFPHTVGIKFSDLSVDKRVVCEVTSKLTRVLSAKVIY